MGRAHEVRKASMEKTAKAKAKLYSMHSKEITQLAKTGGPDPDGNLALRRAIEKAKKAQVPTDTIKRAIDKVKSGAAEDYVEKQFEGYGPGGSTLIVKCMTDNINRCVSQVRPAFSKCGAKLGNEGSVSYLYDVNSVLTFKGMSEDDAIMALLEAEVDAESTTLEDGTVELKGAPTDLYKMKDAIEATGEEVEFIVEEIVTKAQETVELEGADYDKFARLIGFLEDADDVDTIIHNVSNYDDGEEE